MFDTVLSGFQSLFYWMFYFNYDLDSYYAKLDRCFNPYFTGCSTSTVDGELLVCFRTKFQSLFYWMFYFNYVMQYITFIKMSCFNPYFTGCSTSTLVTSSTKKNGMKCFNPYFTGCSTSTKLPDPSHLSRACFNPYFTGCSTSTSPSNLITLCESCQFQSLFYWMFYFNRSEKDGVYFSITCFNPYFTGCSTSTFNFLII